MNTEQQPDVNNLQTQLAQANQQIADFKTKLEEREFSEDLLTQILELDLDIHSPHDVASRLASAFSQVDGRLTHTSGLTVKQALEQFLEEKPHFRRGYDSSLHDAERVKLTRMFGKGASGKLANELAKTSIFAYREARAKAIELNIIPNFPPQRPNKARPN